MDERIGFGLLPILWEQRSVLVWVGGLDPGRGVGVVMSVRCESEFFV